MHSKKTVLPSTDASAPPMVLDPPILLSSSTFSFSPSASASSSSSSSFLFSLYASSHPLIRSSPASPAFDLTKSVISLSRSLICLFPFFPCFCQSPLYSLHLSTLRSKTSPSTVALPEPHPSKEAVGSNSLWFSSLRRPRSTRTNYGESHDHERTRL